MTGKGIVRKPVTWVVYGVNLSMNPVVRSDLHQFPDLFGVTGTA